MRRVPLLLLVGTLLALTPLAHGSPPDPTWIAGFYDDADSDEVILRVTSISAVLEPTLSVAVKSRPLIGSAWVIHEVGLPAARTASKPSRAPPVI